MNIREAILKAADSIQAYPQLFNWSSVQTANPECGTPGCALGWIAFHAGVADSDFTKTCELMSIHRGEHGTFYMRMNSVCGNPQTWKESAGECARTLRLYADKYHPAEAAAPHGIPESVRAIFAAKEVA
jgi:hypothetical protein